MKSCPIVTFFNHKKFLSYKNIMAKRKNRQNNPNAPQNGDSAEQVNGGANQTTNEEQKEEKKPAENVRKEIVLKTYMHCEGCANKVLYILKGFEGVEEVNVDSKKNKVIVRGPKADPSKVLERVQRKYSRNVELIYPKLKANANNKVPEKKQAPQAKVMVLKMNMHCEGCARDIKKHVQSMEGVFSAEPDIKTSQVTVRGTFDPTKLAQKITKRLGVHVEIIKQQDQFVAAKDNKNGPENMFYYPPQNSEYYIYPSQIFSDENVFSCSIM